jgi:hypothetical protein
MNTITFDPEKHLSRSDQDRLVERAQEAGMDVADFIEVVLKQALFAAILPTNEKEAA